MRYQKSPRWRSGCPITNPLQRLGNLLAGRHVLWLDPHPQNNRYAYSFLNAAAAESSESPPVVLSAATADEAIAVLKENSYDLVLTHWGEGAGRVPSGQVVPAAVQLLQGIRAARINVPVIVFASADDASARKRKALSLGAKDYCSGFDPLFRSIETVLVDKAGR